MKKGAIVDIITLIEGNNANKRQECANCNNEAYWIVENDQIPLCYTCKTAYQWGQENPNAIIIDIP